MPVLINIRRGRLAAALICILLAGGVFAQESTQDQVAEFNSLYETYQQQLALTKSRVGTTRYTQYASGLLELASDLLTMGGKLVDHQSETYANLIFLYGNAAYLARDYELAVEQIGHSIELLQPIYGDPSVELLDMKLQMVSAEALADRRLRQSRFDNFLEDVQAVYGRDSNEMETYRLNVGIFILDQLRRSEAGRYIQTAYQNMADTDNPNRAMAGFYAGKIEMANRDYRRAIEPLEMAKAYYDAEENPALFESRMTINAFLVRAYVSTGNEERAAEISQEMGKLSPAEPNSEIVPIYAVQPNYPSDAARAGASGHVDVAFVITTTGQVRDVRIVNIDGRSSFGRSALEAAEKLRYIPRFVDGQPVEVEHYYRFTFEMAP